MTFEQYRDQAYAAVQEHTSHKDAMSHWAVGLTEEAGEVNGVIKHKYYNFENIPVAKIAEELGDVLWYIAAMCTELGINMDAVAKLNLAKNRHKYPDGQFDPQRSANRHKNFEEFKKTPEYDMIYRQMLYLEKEDV